MNCAVGMTTANRPIATVHKSIESLRKTARYNGPLLVLDDAMGARPSHLDAVQWDANNGSLGPLLNWHALLTRLLLEGTPYVCLLEDDILWADNAWEYVWEDVRTIERNGMQDFLYSPFTSYTVSKPLKARHGRDLSPGLYSMNFYGRAGGSQAWFMTRKAGLQLLQDSVFQVRLQKAEAMPFDPTLKAKNMNSDRDNQVTAALMRQGIPVMYRIPSLVNHSLGSANSSYWTKKEQDTEHFDYYPVSLAHVYQ